MKRPCAVLMMVLVLAVAIFPVFSRAQSSASAITQQGLDWRVMSRTVLKNGTNQVHHYTELATGLNYTNSYGQLTASKEVIDILPNGTAQAVQGQHQAYFPGNIAAGQIQVITPDGRQLNSRPMGLSYYDGTNSVLIAELTNAVGYVVGNNVVIYSNAFTDIKADLRYTWRKDGFEQDVILREQPPAPAAFGLNSTNTRLEVLTEYFNTEDPMQTQARVWTNGTAGNWTNHAGSGLTDHTLTFGKMKMTRGRAFSIGNQTGTQGGVPVYKSWERMGGRQFLVEDVPVPDIAAQLQQLPLTASTSPANSGGHLLAVGRQLPPEPLAQTDTGKIQLARADRGYQSGVVLDYHMLDSDSNTDYYTFATNNTYFISDNFNVGSLTIEGGAVIKFGRGQYDDAGDFDVIGVWADTQDGSYPICNTTPDHPAVFTSMNDDSVGDMIDGSSHSSDYNDAGFYNGGWLNLYSSYNAEYGGVYWTDPQLSNLCFFHAPVAITLTSISADFWNCEFLGNSICINLGGGNTSAYENPDSAYALQSLGLHNVLMTQSGGPAAICALNNVYLNLTGENVTADYGSLIFSEEPSEYYDSYAYLDPATVISLTNSLFTGGIVGSADGFYGTITTDHFQYVDYTAFATAANANYYLAPDSLYRNAGTTGINPTTLAAIQTMTTYTPQDGGYPDTDTPDLGYHYSTNEDSDLDGLPDSWEWKYFGSYTNTGGDLDANGYTFLSDYQQGRDPTAPSLLVPDVLFYALTNDTSSFDKDVTEPLPDTSGHGTTGWFRQLDSVPGVSNQFNIRDAIHFGGVHSYVYTTNNPSLFDFTTNDFSCTFVMDALGSDEHGLFGFTISNNPAAGGWYVEYGGSGIELHMANIGTDTYAGETAQSGGWLYDGNGLNTNKLWHCYTITRHGTNVAIYAGGSPVVVTNWGVPLTNASSISSHFQMGKIGVDGTANTSFDGHFASLGIWGRVLGFYEIQHYYNQNFPTLIDNWNLFGSTNDSSWWTNSVANFASTPAYTNGVDGTSSNAGWFNGSQVLNAAAPGATANGYGLGVSFWVNPATLTNSAQFFSWGTNANYAVQSGMDDTNGHFYVSLGSKDPNVTQWATHSSFRLPTNTWSYVTFSWFGLQGATTNTGFPQIYLNGVLDTNVFFTGAIPNDRDLGNSPIQLNYTNSVFSFGNGFSGAASDIQVYNNGLTPAEVWAVYASTNGHVGMPTTGQVTVTAVTGGTGGDTNDIVPDLGWWTFAEGSGTNTDDLSGHGNTGKLTNSPTWATGPTGHGAMIFSAASSQAVKVKTTGSIAGGSNSWSVTAWQKTTSTYSSGGYATYCERAPSGNDILKISSLSAGNHNGSSCVYRNDAGGFSPPDGTTTVNDGNWHFVCITFEFDGVNNYQYVYVDGGECGALPWNGSNTSNNNFTDANQCWIGGDAGDINAYFTGTIADVRVYSTALTPIQVGRLYANGAK